MKRVLGLVGLFSLGCSGVFGPDPAIHAITATPDECGSFDVVLDASGNGEILEIALDGNVIKREAITGENQIVIVQGKGTPGQAGQITAKLGPLFQTENVNFPALQIAPEVTPLAGVYAEKTPADVQITFGNQCPYSSVQWVASLRPINLPDGEPVFSTSGTGSSKLTVPPIVENGSYVLRIESSMDGIALVPVNAQIYWGDPTEDADHDGVPGGPLGTDCDDNDASRNPELPESTTANGKDDNCDGRIDEGTAAFDDDGDGISENGGDCDDQDAGRHPGARELPDCRDQDCDGEIDEGVSVAKSDDALEPNDTQEHAYDLNTSREKSFTRNLTFVTRDPSDDEWVRFYSQDGDWDDWRIEVTVTGAPEGVAYDISIEDTGLRSTQRIAGVPNSFTVLGRAFREDSGDYWLHIHPVSVERPWCPITVTLSSY